MFNVDRGLALSVPAATSPQMLVLYVGARDAVGELTVRLSDNSAPAYSTQIVQGAGKKSFVVEVTFAADTAGASLSVEYVVAANTAPTGSYVSVAAAALMGDLPDQAPTIDAIVDQFVIEGDTLVLPVAANDPDGPGPLVLTESNTLPQAPALLTDFGGGIGELSYHQTPAMPATTQ